MPEEAGSLLPPCWWVAIGPLLGWLIDRFAPLVARGGHAFTIVFDGARGVPSGVHRTGVDVHYTAAGVTADDELVFAVAATADAVLVVTDDQELRRRVLAEGADVIGGTVLVGALDP
jgi:predicted RNA-binding protein with PIN domain